MSMLVPSQPSSTSAALNSGNSGGSGNPNDNDNGSQNSGGTGNGPEFKRKLSKREKKELKKQEKLQKQKAKENKGDESVADQLYTGRISCYLLGFHLDAEIASLDSIPLDSSDLQYWSSCNLKTYLGQIMGRKAIELNLW